MSDLFIQTPEGNTETPQPQSSPNEIANSYFMPISSVVEESAVDEKETDPVEVETKKGEVVETVEEVPEVVESKQGKDTPKAQKRIRQLVEQRNAAEETLSSLKLDVEKQVAALRSQFATELQGLQQQNQMLNQQLSQIGQRRNVEDEEAKLARMQPLERWEYNFKKQQEAELERRLQEQLAPFRKTLDDQERAKKAAENSIKQRSMMEKFKSNTAKARQDLVANEWDPEDATNLAQETDDMLITYAAAFQVPPDQAARAFKQYLDKATAARIKYMQTSQKAKAAKTANVGGAPRSAPIAGGAEGFSSFINAPIDQIKAAGYPNRLAAWNDGFSRMRKG